MARRELHALKLSLAMWNFCLDCLLCLGLAVPMPKNIPGALHLQKNGVAIFCQFTPQERSTIVDLKNGSQSFGQHSALNLPGWCWARIKQLALIGSSSSLHSEACKALGGSDGVVHSTISLAAICIRAVAKDSAVTAARGDRRATCTPSGHSLHGLAPLRPHTVRPDSPQAEHRAPPALLEHLCHAAWRRSPAVGVAKVIPSRPFGYDQV